MTIFLLYLLVSVLILWVFIKVRGNWILKSLMIIGTLYFSLFLGLELRDRAGWPTTEKVPFEIQVLGIRAYQDAESNKKINVWGVNRTPNSRKDARSYFIPYTPENHRMANKIQQMLQKGQKVILKNNGKGKGQGKGNNGKGKGKKRRRGKGSSKEGEGHSGESEGQFEFYKLPPPKLPRKEGN